MARQQMTTENTDKFLLEQHKLSKNCQFVNVTDEKYLQELVRDAFINEFTYNMIRQRLLES